MKERPILFNNEMVRAVLDGRKKQTRRVVKPSIIQEIDVERDKTFTMDSIVYDLMDGLKVRDVCPYGQPGDRLWVREAFAYVDMQLDDHDREDPVWVGYRSNKQIRFLGGLPNSSVCRQDCFDWDDPRIKWRPSIYMPRWASRITLEITDIRVKRVQNISHNDACREGVLLDGPGDDPVSAFERLWDTINAKRGFGWSSNPWVWVLEFNVIEGVA